MGELTHGSGLDIKYIVGNLHNLLKQSEEYFKSPQFFKNEVWRYFVHYKIHGRRSLQLFKTKSRDILCIVRYMVENF